MRKASKVPLSERLPERAPDLVRNAVMFAETAETAARSAMGTADAGWDTVRDKAKVAFDWWSKAAYECGVAKMQKECSTCVENAARMLGVAGGFF